LKRRNFLLFFFLPLIGIIIIFFALSSLNRTYIRNKVQDLVKEQLQATAEILKVNISHFLSENYTTDKIFELYADEKNIYYMAFLDENNEILGWSSRFEGYLPLSQQALQGKDSWIIDSPAGKIFNLLSSFSAQDGEVYSLYLGYSLENLEQMILHSRRNFYIVFGLICAVGFVFFMGLYQLQNRYLEKKKEAEEEKKEKERYREISAFTSGVAHEIKNPLNSLSLLCELLLKRVSPELKENVTLGREEIQKISKIIDQFSASLKPLELSKEKFFLEDMITGIRDTLKRELENKGLRLLYSQRIPVSLNVDRRLMSQAFTNLIKNSLEAAEKGDIIIKADQHRKMVSISVRDTGRGIREEDREQIFDPFFSRKEKGMGIGLYITKKIIEAHEGKIEFQSGPEKGATFHIQIPGD
jgi:signal transduction histidine kinase